MGTSSSSSSPYTSSHGGSTLTLDRCCDMEVRVTPKQGPPIIGTLHAYNHHRRMLWLRCEKDNMKDDIIMIKTKFISHVEVIRESPWGSLAQSKCTISQHFAKFQIQPRRMSPPEIGLIYESKSEVHRKQELEFERRKLAGKLDGLGALILYKLSQKYPPSSISVDSKRSIVFNSSSVIIKRPYLPQDCILVDAQIAKEKGVLDTQNKQLQEVRKIVDGAGDEYDDFNKGG